MASAKKLLVADDSLTIQKVIRLALSNEGYEIQAVSDGNDAIQQISLFRPDVVLVDVSLPGKSAFEVKRAVNEQGDFDDVRFVLMSSAFEKVDEVQVKEVKFHGRLTKPFDPAHLRSVLSSVLSQVAAKKYEKTSLLQRPEAIDGPLPLKAPPPPADKITLAPPEAPETVAETPLKGHDDLSEPIHPVGEEEEPIVEAPPEPERVASLWDPKERESDAFEGFTPPPLPGQPAPEEPEASSIDEEAPESDIRKLTESTIKMSGLDEMNWSINESKVMKPSPSLVGDRTLTDLTTNEPKLPPMPSMADLGGATFRLDEPPKEEGYGMPQFDPDAAETAPPSFAPPPGALKPPPEAPSAAEAYLSAPDTPETPEFAEAPPQPTDVMPISTAQMEEMLSRQLQGTIEKMAQKILPDIAERVIKQEINRMLREPPA